MGWAPNTTSIEESDSDGLDEDAEIWEEHTDSTGKIYYYNPISQKTSWTLPKDENPDEDDEDEDDEDDEDEFSVWGAEKSGLQESNMHESTIEPSNDKQELSQMFVCPPPPVLPQDNSIDSSSMQAKNDSTERQKNLDSPKLDQFVDLSPYPDDLNLKFDSGDDLQSLITNILGSQPQKPTRQNMIPPPTTSSPFSLTSAPIDDTFVLTSICGVDEDETKVGETQQKVQEIAKSRMGARQSTHHYERCQDCVCKKFEQNLFNKEVILMGFFGGEVLIY